MRHAKSAWDDPMADDFDRTLNGRGRTSAKAIAEWLVKQGHLPDTVIVSSARRTVETWERMAPDMPETATMESSPALYLAGPEIIHGVLKSQTAPSVMIICHNPGIAEYAGRILASPPAHPDFHRYPTAATTVMEFDQNNWSDIAWASAKAIDFVVPRDLKG